MTIEKAGVHCRVTVGTLLRTETLMSTIFLHYGLIVDYSVNKLGLVDSQRLTIAKYLITDQCIYCHATLSR